MEMQKILVQIFFERKSNLLMDGKLESLHLAVCGENLMECEEDQIFQVTSILFSYINGKCTKTASLSKPSKWVYFLF